MSVQDLACQNCGMVFDRPEHLSRHQQKFCVGSNYADIQSLEQKYNSEFRNADSVKLPRSMPSRQPDHTDQEYRLELQKERIRANGMAKREYEKVLGEIRRQEEKKFNANAEKQAVMKELRKLEKMEAGELADQKQKELNLLNNRKKVLQAEEETLKHQLDRFMSRKRDLEAESTTELAALKTRGSEVRGQLNQARQLEDDYAIGQGKKMAQLQYKKQSLQHQKKSIEDNLQVVRQRRQQGGDGLAGSELSSPMKFPPSSYTFKPQPYDKAEEYRRLALQSQSSEYAENKLNTINKAISGQQAAPNSQLISQRQQELAQLKQDYASNGGDDPRFFDKIERLQEKYNAAGSRAANPNPAAEPKFAPSELPHRSYQPPKIDKSRLSEGGSASQPALNPFYNPNSPYEMYERFAVRPKSKVSPQYILPPNTFGNDEKLLLEQRIAPDQSIEERVMSSVLAQQYDALQILSRLPKDSEIYKLKLKQYQELSKIRQDLVKEAHQQRLLKVKRQFQMEKRLAEKDFENDAFVDKMRMDLINKKVGESPLKTNRLHFSVEYETVSGLPLQVHSCKVALSLYYQGQQISAVRQTQPKECEKREDDNICRLFERMDCAIEPRQNATAAFDVLVSHRDSPENFKLYAYGTVRLTNQDMKLGLANYELNLFEPPYRPLTTTQREVEIPNNLLYLKIFQGANPPDSDFVNPRGMSHKTQYAIFNAMMSSSFIGPGSEQRQQRPLSNAGLQPSRGGPRKLQSQGPKGYELRLAAIRTERPEQTVWLQLSLFEQDKPLLSKKGVPLSYKSEYKQTVDIARRNNNMAEARLNEAFKIYEDLERLYKRNQRQLYLMVQLMSKVGSQGRLKGWHCLRLTNFQELREGLVKINMFSPEAEAPPFDMNKAKEKLRDEVEFEIVQFTPSEEELAGFSKASLVQPNPPQAVEPKRKTQQSVGYEPSMSKQAPMRRSQESQKKPQESMKSSKPSIRETMTKNQPTERSNNSKKQVPNKSTTSILNKPEPSKAILDQPFISNSEMQYRRQPEGATKSFDFHISKITNFPGGIGLCKLYITALDSKNRKLLPTEQFMTPYSENESVYNQAVGYTRHVRNCKMPAEAIAMIHVCSYNQINGQVGLLGVAIVPLFIEEDKDHYLTSGHYQVPVFWSPLTDYLDIDSAFTLPRIPGVSILVSIDKEINEEEIPEYQTGSYSTVFFEVDAVEQEVLNALYKRGRYTQKESVQEFFKTKGIGKQYKPKEVEEYLSKNIKNTGKLLNINHLLPKYQPDFGFTLVIDGLKQTEGTCFYLITICLSPPASYYMGERMDLVFLMNTNLESHRCFPLYNNNTFSYNEQFVASGCFVLEVVEIQLVNSSNFEVTLNSFGYAIIPVFDPDRKVLQAGEFELELHEGDFPEEKIEKLKDYHKNRREFEEKTNMVKNVTLNVKLVNNYFPSQWVPQTDPSEFYANAIKAIGKNTPKIAEEDKIKRLLPKELTQEKFFQLLDECVYKLYDEE